MKISEALSLLSSLFVCCFLFVSCQSNCPCTISEDDKAYFETEIANSQETWNSGDREGYGNRYADDAVFMVSNGETLVGKDAIQEWLNSIPEIKVQFDVAESIGSCNLAVVRGTFQLTQPDGTMADKGKWLEVWQKSEDGQWQLTRDIFNSDMPLPEAGGEEEASSEE